MSNDNELAKRIQFGEGKQFFGGRKALPAAVAPEDQIEEEEPASIRDALYLHMLANRIHHLHLTGGEI